MNRAGLLLFSILLFLPAVGAGEFRCSAEIKYRWQKEGAEPQITFWATAEKRGEAELATRELLQRAVDRERVQAAEGCVRRHQNMSGCISSKIAAFGELMQSMTFSARNKLEESIASDCEKAQGFCRGVEVSEISCTDLNPPPPPEAEADDSGDKKDKKKKR